MEIMTLYRYEREPNKVTVSTEKPNVEYTELYRLIADEGKILVNGDIQTTCIDVESTEGWTEVDAPEEPTEPDEPIVEPTESDYAEAGKILLGVTE